MSHKQYEGRTAAEAAIKACEDLGVSRSQLKYEIVADQGEGLERRVSITVDASNLPAPRPEDDEPPRRDDTRHEARSDRGGDRGGGGGGRGGDRGGRGGGFGGGGGGGGRGRRGGRDRDRGGRGGGGGGWGGGRGGDRGGRGGGGRPPRDDGDGFETLLNLEIMPAELPPPRAEVTTAPSPKAQKGLEALAKLLEFMEMQVTAHLVQDQPEEIHFELRGSDVSHVIGKKGDVLLSLQFVLNRIVSRSLGDVSESGGEGEGDSVLVLDAAGYRQRRRAALADLAKKLAERAVAEGKVVRLSPMSAHDRRVFHMTLKELEGVNTRSEGDGLYRNLLIIPAQFG